MHKKLLLLLLISCALPVIAETPKLSIETEIVCAQTNLMKNPYVDVFVSNTATQNVYLISHSPSGPIGVPKLFFSLVPNGETNCIPIGLCSDDWVQWYQVLHGSEAMISKRIVIPGKTRLRLLHVNLILLMTHVNEQCKSRLLHMDELTVQEILSNKETINAIDKFLSGGWYDISVRAYANSKVVRVNCFEDFEVQNPPPPTNPPADGKR